MWENVVVFFQNEVGFSWQVDKGINKLDAKAKVEC
jgi:hypothetical protein